MKLIKAIIRPEKLNDVLKALYQAEVHGITVSPNWSKPIAAQP